MLSITEAGNTLLCGSKNRHIKYTAMHVPANISSIFSSNFEANASKLLENIEEKCPHYNC